MDKTRYIVWLIIIFVTCSNDSSLASDSQRSWCIASEEKVAGLIENWSLTNRYTQEEIDFLRDYAGTRFTAVNIYENDYQVVIDEYPYDYFITKLYENDQRALRICKIHADINDIN